MAGLLRALKHQDRDADGYDWDWAAQRLTSPVIQREPWQRAWRHFDTLAARGIHPHGLRGDMHPYYYHGNYGGPTLEDMTAWIWTPETASAFSLLLLAMTIFGCCWFSHKLGEALCTTVSGFFALVVLALVLWIFLSQWI